MDNYNNFPATYQGIPTTTATPASWQRNLSQYYQQYYQPQTSTNYQQPQQNTEIKWVDGEQAARAYNLPNGTTLPLWDSEKQTIYIKSVDQNGRPSMTILDYVERVEKNPEKDEKTEYATKDQIAELNEQFSALNKKLSGFGDYVTKEQLSGINDNVSILRGQIEDIENRITSFGKPQQSNNNYRIIFCLFMYILFKE
mgnify:CR=1 FL=1